MNVLLVTLDQMRGDCLSCAGHPVVRTPSLDRLAAEGVRFGRHYSQAAPCSPGRACLYTGTYQLNNRVVGNGTPLDDRFDNVARAARRAGYRPVLFGYTDIGADPRLVERADDARLWTYEGVLPGLEVELALPQHCEPWLAWLASLGYDDAVTSDAERALGSEPDRPAEHSITAFAVDRFIAWLERQDHPWWAHLSLLRPHPPYAAAGTWANAYDPADVGLPVPALPVAESGPAGAAGAAAAAGAGVHPFLRAAVGRKGAAAPDDEASMRRLRAQYFGMVSHVDQELGRIWAALERAGQWDDTFIAVTSDHGEQLGDQGLIGKLGFFDASYHVPAIVRDPRHGEGHGVAVEQFTENVDLMPTLCSAMQLPVPAQCDGLPLTPFLRGLAPPWWRGAAHWEFDWRVQAPGVLAEDALHWPWQREPDRQNLAVIRTDDAAYVQFGDGSWLGFDLAADPTWATPCHDPARLHSLAASMLAWRAEHAERTMTGFILADGGIGRRPGRGPQ